MKELSPEKKLRLEKLELLTYEVEVGNTHRVRKVKGTMLNSAFLLETYSSVIFRASAVSYRSTRLLLVSDCR